MSNKLHSTLAELFDGFETAGENEAVLPLVDFEPLVRPEQLEIICSAMNSAVPSWEGVTALAGLAERSSGPLTQLLAHRRKLPYSLVNWYPEGSQGDIVVGPALSFTGEKGNTFLNGFSKDDTIVYVDDCVRGGGNARNVLNAAKNGGVKVAGAVFVASFEGADGVEALSKEFGIPVVALCQVDASGERTKLVSVMENITPYAPPALPDMKAIKQWTDAQMMERYQKVLDAFVGNPIYYADNSEYPYCNFTLTDCQPLLQPELVEAMAECMVSLGDFSKADVLVSEADRGGGPLIAAVARRTGLPFTMANWKPPAKKVGVAAAASVGYSGNGSLYLSGIKQGAKCIVLDDMLSSGGTAEGLYRAIEAAGGVIIEAHFASEKVTTKGRDRLAKNWPDMPTYSLCYFAAEGQRTITATPGPRANETPLQKKGGEQKAKAVDQKKGVGAWLHKAVLAAVVVVYCMA